MQAPWFGGDATILYESKTGKTETMDERSEKEERRYDSMTKREHEAQLKTPADVDVTNDVTIPFSMFEIRSATTSPSSTLASPKSATTIWPLHRTRPVFGTCEGGEDESDDIHARGMQIKSRESRRDESTEQD